MMPEPILTDAEWRDLYRFAAATRSHAAMLSRTDSAGRPLYRVTRGGNVVRTKPITQRLKRKVLTRDGFACLECGSTRFLEVAHITPYRESGDNRLENLRTPCHACHVAEEARA